MTALEERLAEIRARPERHQHHSVVDLHSCCIVEGALHLSLVEAHSEVSTRSNGGVKCDVGNGPCSCGAWH